MSPLICVKEHFQEYWNEILKEKKGWNHVITITVILNNYDFDIFTTSKIGKCNVYSLSQNISPYNINKAVHTKVVYKSHLTEINIAIRISSKSKSPRQSI